MKLLKTYLNTFFIIYLVVLVIKLVGLRDFDLDTENIIITIIDDFCTKYHLIVLIKGLILSLSFVAFNTISCANFSRKMILVSLLEMPIIVAYKWLISPLGLWSILLDYVILLAIIYFNKRVIMHEKGFKVLFINYTLFSFLNIVYQCVSNMIRGIEIDVNQLFVEYLILNLDYISILIITMLLFKDFMIKKGGNNLWTGVRSLFGDLLVFCGQSLVSFGASLKHLIISLKASLTKQSRDGKKEKKSNIGEKKEKKIPNQKKINCNDIAISIIFILLFLLWNFFTVFVILFIAKINNTLIECTIILCSFLITKTAFGKPLHLKKAINCFLLSNFVYYCLNRITLPIGFSILFPIVLGVSVSYGASYVMKYISKDIVKGMNKDDLVDICTRFNLTELEKDVLVMYYCDRLSINQITYKIKYSYENTFLIKKKALNKIKGPDI